MKFILEIDEREMLRFLDVFFAGVTLPVSSQDSIEKRLIKRVSDLGVKHDEYAASVTNG